MRVGVGVFGDSPQATVRGHGDKYDGVVFVVSDKDSTSKNFLETSGVPARKYPSMDSFCGFLAEPESISLEEVERLMDGLRMLGSEVVVVAGRNWGFYSEIVDKMGGFD